MRLAFTTITVLRHPYGHPEIVSFQDRIGPVFLEAENSPGFIDRARPVDDRVDLTNFERDWGEWGAFQTPRFYTGGRVTATDSRASTLSLWTDLASVWAYAHHGLHRYMLQNQSQWVTRFDWKNYAAWWVGDEVTPTWSEACARLEQINDHGSSPDAFDFRRPFDSDGQPAPLPRTRRSAARSVEEPIR